MKKHVVIVDGYSTGVYYVDILNEKNIPAIHVASVGATSDSEFGSQIKHYLEAGKSKFAAQIDGNMGITDLAEIVRKYKPLAVCAGCETGVELAGQLAAELGLPGNDPAFAESTRDKYLMHQALAEAGVRELKSWLGDNSEQLIQWVEEIGLPVVLKPTKSSASDGIHFCNTVEEVQSAFDKLHGSKSIFGGRIEKVMAQEFVSGQEVVINTVSCEGKHIVSDLWAYKKHVVEDGRSIYDGGELVEDFGELTDATIKYVFSVLDALKIELGPAHTEVMLTKDGPVLIECGARPMGATYPQELLKEALGYTQLEMALEAYLEPEKFLQSFGRPYKLRKHFYIKCLISNREGSIDSVPGVSLLAGLPSVRLGNFLSCLENDSIDRTVDFLSSFGSIFLCHENRKVLYEDLSLIQSLEQEAENMLVALSPEKDNADPDWFEHIPDELWLKSDEEAAADTQLLMPLLKLAPGLNVLDCPCGTAGVSVGLARQGAHITGFDLNPRFIEGAQKRFAEAGLEGEFMVMDMRELNIDSKFDAALNWFNSIGYFDIETDFDILKRLAKSLVPGGILILEAPNRSNVLDNTRVKYDEHGNELIRKWDELSEKVYMPIKVGEGEDAKIITSQCHLYSLAQFKLLFRLAGLELEVVYNEDLEPLTDSSKRMILIGRKPTE